MTGTLDEKTRDRLIKILGRLGSEHDGERAAAGLMAHRMIVASGLGWEAVIGGQSSRAVPYASPPPRPAARKPRGFSESGLRGALRDIAVHSLSKHMHLLNAEEQSMARTVIEAAMGDGRGRWNKYWQQKLDYLSGVIRRRMEEKADA